MNYIQSDRKYWLPIFTAFLANENTVSASVSMLNKKDPVREEQYANSLTAETILRAQNAISAGFAFCT